MIRKCLCVLAVLCVMLCASGCKKEVPQPQPQASHPTLPDFQEELSPLEQLAAAIEKTAQQETYEIQYGRKTVSDGETVEKSQQQSVTSQKLLDRNKMYEFLPELPEKDGFLEEFTGKSVRIVPSNTGVLRFQLSDLKWEDVWPMLYSQEPAGEFQQFTCEIALEVDAAGRFTKFEMIMTRDEQIRMIFLLVSFPENS